MISILPNSIPPKEDKVDASIVEFNEDLDVLISLAEISLNVAIYCSLHQSLLTTTDISWVAPDCTPVIDITDVIRFLAPIVPYTENCESVIDLVCDKIRIAESKLL